MTIEETNTDLEKIAMKRAEVQEEISRIITSFSSQGAQLVDVKSLLPARTLIDLYGENLRERAYTTYDPVFGEQMLRPDFTVPVVQMHVESLQDQAQYSYFGQVWRRSKIGGNTPTEYLQVGYENFGNVNTEQADASVFAMFKSLLSRVDVTAITGDIGLIFAAIDCLETSEPRKQALRRHVWRPYRFDRLLTRFSREKSKSSGHRKSVTRAKNKNVREVIENSGIYIGLRSISEIIERIDALEVDANTPPLSGEQMLMINEILTLECPVAEAAERLSEITLGAPKMQQSVNKLEARKIALDNIGIDTDQLLFRVAYGRESLEYYDGFVFGFNAKNSCDLPQIAQGGRYDAMTRVLGNGKVIPAVGGIIRPEALVTLQKEG